MTVVDIVLKVSEMYGRRKATQQQIADELKISKRDVAETTQILGYIRTVIPQNALEKVIIREQDYPFLKKYILR